MTDLTRMLAVWEGDPPQDDIAARQLFEELYSRFVWNGDPHDLRRPNEPATERIAAYVAALLRRWPSPAGEEGDYPVWESGLVGNESGPLVYFGVRWSMADEVSAFAAQVATSTGLVCFDVSQGRVLS